MSSQSGEGDTSTSRQNMHALGPTVFLLPLNVGFARLEFIGDNRFDLAYFRHTGKWWTIFSELTVDEALKEVSQGGIFTP